MSWAEGTEGTASNMPKNLRKYQIEAHWLWVLNSALLVILLLGLFSTILVRTLRNDVSRYLQIEDIEAEEFGELDDSGWKRVGFDVFRAPAHPYIFSSIVGIGAQLLMISLFLLILALVGVAYAGNHGSMYLAAIILYSFTAYVAGYVASAKLKEIGMCSPLSAVAPSRSLSVHNTVFLIIAFMKVIQSKNAYKKYTCY